MATRTIKLIGEAYSTSGDVSLVINMNNTEVYNGTVTTINEPAPARGGVGVELASWTIDTSVTGLVPLSIAVTGGTFNFNDLHGNYSGWETETDAEGNITVTVQPVDYFGWLNENTAESDGKDNVAFSVPNYQSRDLSDDPSLVGDWVYTINDGVTFTCDFVLDANNVVLEVPAWATEPPPEEPAP